MNQYHIYEAIGRGKHSTVYKGRKKKTIEYYAIKSVDKSQKSRVLQEVRTLHSLDHSNVLKFHAWYETSAHLWLVLEYCVGGDLLTLLRQDTRLPEESIHDFARDLVNALQFLHSKGVIYCDLKPSNILLDENGRLKLCDFGLARRLSDIAKSSVQQLPQAKRGTPCYMAPELFQDGGVHSFASDLWALGCVMYECYAGRPPFVSNSFTQLVNSILADPTPSLQSSPSKEFEDLVMSLLIKDPAKRLQWPEICQHPFWRAKLKLLMFPPQPAFARFLQQNNFGCDNAASQGTSASNAKNASQDQNSRRLDAHAGYKKATTTPRDTESCDNVPSSKPLNNGKQTNIRNPIPSKEDLGQKNRGVNLLRLSKIVKTNLQRETEGGNYRQQGQNVHVNGEDVVIENNDLELDFAEQTEGDSNDDEDVPDISASRESSAAEYDKCIASNNEKEQSGKLQMPSSNLSEKNGRNDIEHGKGDIEKAQVALARLDVAATPPGVGLPRKVQRTQTHYDQKKVVSNSPAQGNGEPLKTSLVISQALWHLSDLAVRPIMVCKKVDKLAEPGYDLRSLPCDPIAPADFIKLTSEEMESFVNKIVVSISGSTALNEKLNTLKYLETLCSNVHSANVLINGSVMYALIKMLRTTKPPALRIQVIYAMGLLIRHATLIEEELANTGIITVLSEGLRDKQDKVRRCSMATLGELLFYIATQNEGSPRSTAGCDPTKDGKFVSSWQVPSTLIALIASILRKGEDDATQHYAVKTIENISSQGGEWAARFTNQGVLENLCYIFKASGKQESLRLTAGSCLVRLLRFNASNAPFVLEKLNMKELSMGLSKSNLKEQQVNINLLNIFLNMPMSNAKQIASLLEEKSLVSNLLTILEQSTEVLRGKALVCAALLCKVNRRWLTSFCSSKLLAIIERLTKEKDGYVKQCVDALIQTIVDLVPNILDSIGTDVQQPGGSKRLTPHTSRHPVRSSLALFPIILHLFESPVFREKIINAQILKQLAGFLGILQTTSSSGLDEFHSTLLRIFEVFGQQSSIPLGYPDVFFRNVLPSLANLYRKNSSGDTRFLCLKIFFDVLVAYLDDIADSHTSDRSRGCGSATQEDLRSIARQQFLPYYSKLLDDDDPIPMYAQKLLVMLLDVKCIGIEDILALKLLSQFFDFLHDDFSTVNLHNVRLCLFLASASEVKTSALSELGISERVGALIEFVHGRDMEDFLEPSLSLCKSLLIRCSTDEMNGVKDEGVKDIGEFVRYMNIFLELCCGHELQVAEVASECLILLMKVVPEKAGPVLALKLPLLRNALECCISQGSNSTSRMQRLLLLTLSAVCREQRMGHSKQQGLTISSSDSSALLSVVDRLRNSNNQAVAGAAADAYLELEVLLGQT